MMIYGRKVAMDEACPLKTNTVNAVNSVYNGKVPGCVFFFFKSLGISVGNFEIHV